MDDKTLTGCDCVHAREIIFIRHRATKVGDAGEQLGRDDGGGGVIQIHGRHAVDTFHW